MARISSVRPGSDQAGDADDLPAPDGQRAIAQAVAAREVADGQDRRARLPARADAEEIAEVAANHRPDQLLLSRPAGHELAGVSAVPVDRDPVAEREDLLDPVRDEQEADPLVHEPPDHAEEDVDLCGY